MPDEKTDNKDKLHTMIGCFMAPIVWMTWAIVLLLLFGASGWVWHWSWAQWLR